MPLQSYMAFAFVLQLLCERFCTSKLTRFEDLRSLTS